MQHSVWADDGLGGALRAEVHYDGRQMMCFSERPATLVEMFDGLVRRFPQRPAIVEDRTISYLELDRLVTAISGNLAALGVARGDRVALFLGNCWEFLACVIACNRIGAIVVPIGTRQRQAELTFLLNDSDAKALVFESDLAGAVPPRQDVPSLVHRFAVGVVAPDAKPFADLLAAPAPAVRAPELSEEDVAVILYTSGTTGRPKGAQLTHLGIIHSALSFARCHGLSATDRALVAVPLSHVTGLVGVALSSMIVGGCVVLMRQAFKTADFLALASREGITYSILVPTIYTLCVMSSELEAYDLSAWRIGCFGGAPMPIATIEMLAEKLPHLQLLNAYGATETTSPSTIMPRAQWRHHIDSVGITVPCGQIKVVDDDGREVPRGTPGELWIAGPMVVPGYWRRPDANESEFVDGFWRSGDIGAMDTDGFVRVFDRKKDMINRGGFKVFSAEVENVLCSLDGVLECAIVGRADPVLGERVHAVVVIAEGSALAEVTVKKFCAERLSDYKVPETITLRTLPLPRNANGKILKSELRENKTTTLSRLPR
ncbi:class I adenylate-forming enzyme family protein [Bradyrhizobium septentrionale]|uniref:Acyl--CoA ligase n=1 Tax=Bradyrhizobium septentrionale TaxID=1404411 RepID=A0A973W8H2_9BRAD|nr:class I adenylate-forming enzyme family protein [Bradyrhizobium septentrionale]UGY17687.1 acyl--CoA ligase [Bradyrhizobium septentrionale]UGY26424.1 acyl--CoA ligase [Bradyrhizobium septentrionale]